MSDLAVLEKVKESIIFEAAWLYHTIQTSDRKKDDFLDFVKTVWNRGFPRAGFGEYFQELSFDEEDIKKVAELWSREKDYVGVDEPQDVSSE